MARGESGLKIVRIRTPLKQLSNLECRRGTLDAKAMRLGGINKESIAYNDNKKDMTEALARLMKPTASYFTMAKQHPLGHLMSSTQQSPALSKKKVGVDSSAKKREKALTTGCITSNGT